MIFLHFSRKFFSVHVWRTKASRTCLATFLLSSFLYLICFLLASGYLSFTHSLLSTYLFLAFLHSMSKLFPFFYVVLLASLFLPPSPPTSAAHPRGSPNLSRNRRPDTSLSLLPLPAHLKVGQRVHPAHRPCKIFRQGPVWGHCSSEAAGLVATSSHVECGGDCCKASCHAQSGGGGMLQSLLSCHQWWACCRASCHAQLEGML
jgi:hypothetical protein